MSRMRAPAPGAMWSPEAESSKSRRNPARSRGRAWATAIRITSDHWESDAFRTRSPKSPSSTAAFAPR